MSKVRATNVTIYCDPLPEPSCLIKKNLIKTKDIPGLLIFPIDEENSLCKVWTIFLYKPNDNTGEKKNFWGKKIKISNKLTQFKLKGTLETGSNTEKREFI